MTICNTNRIRQSKATEYGLTPSLLAFLFENDFARYSFNYSWQGYNSSDRLNMSTQFRDWRTRHNFSNTLEIYETLAHQCEEMFLLVYLPNLNRASNITELCSGRNRNEARFVPVMTLLYGLCYRLVPGSSSDFTPPG